MNPPEIDCVILPGGPDYIPPPTYEELLEWAETWDYFEDQKYKL